MYGQICGPRFKFELGTVVTTPGAMVAMVFNGVNAWELVKRHAQGDYGQVSEEDKIANEQAIVGGARVMSSYLLNDGSRLWIITEADRSSTCILTPEEY